MTYETFLPGADLSSIVKCYWTLEVPAQENPERQLIVPDGCIEMIFILGDDVRRFTSGDGFVIQPRSMVLGQITEPFYVMPTGYVNSFAVRFYPYSFANFVAVPIMNLANKETPLNLLFGEEVSARLADRIEGAADTTARIRIVEEFLLERLTSEATIDNIVKLTVDRLLISEGKKSIQELVANDRSKRRQLERKFARQIGISPKQLGKIIRLQSALALLLDNDNRTLTEIAYETDYYDQAHFIKDFREFTGTTPGAFLSDGELRLSALLYRKS